MLSENTKKFFACGEDPTADQLITKYKEFIATERWSHLTVSTKHDILSDILKRVQTEEEIADWEKNLEPLLEEPLGAKFWGREDVENAMMREAKAAEETAGQSEVIE